MTDGAECAMHYRETVRADCLSKHRERVFIPAEGVDLW